ncbi:NAD-dependent epimerase/dehydratase family protein [Streptomyces sp. NPDC051104]|uniref:NAD-dependent epimerase/dehydratase family protein n=1 Tax=Streptomyces sp. NPDC051104 TaxID=3155044 RepID=UPI00343EA065
MRTVLITGAAGFLGGHVAQEAGRRGMALTLMSHRRPVHAAGPGRRVVPADLTDPDSLRGVCEGVDVLLHCASYIGTAPEANESVNARGTRNLLAEAHRAGVPRIVYVSTASVYGRGTFRGAGPGQLVRNPGSPTSLSRAAAEDAVLEAGGVVLRPHLVYGPGDTWVVPGMVRLLRALPGTVEGWSARMSVISVRDLARLVVGSGLASAADLTSITYHAAHPVPVTSETLLRAAAVCASLTWPQRRLSVTEARELLAADSQSSRALDMLRTDHWFDGMPLWRDLRLVPGPEFAADFPESAQWYRRSLLPA